MILVIDRDINFASTLSAKLKEFNPGQNFQHCTGDNDDWKLYNDPAVTHMVVGQPAEVHNDWGAVNNYDAPVIELLESMRLGAIWRKSFSEDSPPKQIFFRPRSKFQFPILVVRRQGDNSVPREFLEPMIGNTKFIRKFYRSVGANDIINWPGDDEGLKDAFNTIIQRRD